MHVAFELIVVCCERIQGLTCEQQTVRAGVFELHCLLTARDDRQKCMN